MEVGYLGIVVPDRKLWQGYFIKDDFAEQAAHMVKTIMGNEQLRTGSQVLSKQDDSILRTIELFEQALGVKVRSKLRVIPDEYQSAVGTICATMVSALLGETEPEHPGEAVIGVCGYALREIIKRDYFWIEARRDSKGTYTTLHPIYVSSIDEAREVINTLTVVRKIQRRLLAAYVPEGQHRIH
jgi:hypothetical protein